MNRNMKVAFVYLRHAVTDVGGLVPRQTQPLSAFLT